MNQEVFQAAIDRIECSISDLVDRLERLEVFIPSIKRISEIENRLDQIDILIRENQSLIGVIDRRVTPKVGDLENRLYAANSKISNLESQMWAVERKASDNESKLNRMSRY